MPQMLLFSDPRPLVDRLGADFFRQAPECPGVYLMRDAADTVLYVGKARNLRKRLGSYRVANPVRLRRRHLKLLRAVAGIELQRCPDESSALARESELLLALRPRFNRAGTWPALPRLLVWRVTERELHMNVVTASEPEGRRSADFKSALSPISNRQSPDEELYPLPIGWGEGPRSWHCFGPLGAFAFPLRAALVRLLWCAVHPDRGLAGMPEGWFEGRRHQSVTIPRPRTSPVAFGELEQPLRAFFSDQVETFLEWLRDHAPAQPHPFDMAVREADLETLSLLKTRKQLNPPTPSDFIRPPSAVLLRKTGHS